MQPFKVKYEDALAFSKVWNHKGIAVPLQDVHVQFANDFANICLRSFVEDMMKQAAQRKAEAEKAVKPLIEVASA